jgi:hypothetical protein
MSTYFISLADWLEKHSLPCFYKQVFHMDCPGCGIQRALVELLRGHLKQSFIIYPALIPIILMLVYLILHLKFKFTNGAENLKRLFFLNTTIIVFNYIYKLII